MGVVIDTGVFIRWEREGRGVDFSRWAHFGSPSISVISESELKVGLHRANSEPRKRARALFVQAVLSSVVILPIDSPVADIHAELASMLMKSGIPIGPHDYWIAATALRHDYHLLTTNTAEFSRVPRLKVIDFLAPG